MAMKATFMSCSDRRESHTMGTITSCSRQTPSQKFSAVPPRRYGAVSLAKPHRSHTKGSEFCGVPASSQYSTGRYLEGDICSIFSMGFS